MAEEKVHKVHAGCRGDLAHKVQPERRVLPERREHLARRVTLDLQARKVMLDLQVRKATLVIRATLDHRATWDLLVFLATQVRKVHKGIPQASATR